MYIAPPEIEINGRIAPQFTRMRIDNSVDKWHNMAHLTGTFSYDEGLIEYLAPTLPGSRNTAIIRMDGETLFTGYIVGADYGYSSSGGFYTIELYNYTHLLISNKENLEQQKQRTYKQIIDWLITGLDYITIKYECGGGENEVVDLFDMGPTETIIAAIRRLIGRKGWGCYTNNEGELIIRDWKMNNGVASVIQEGGNVLTAKSSANIKGIYKRYVVIAKKDKQGGGAKRSIESNINPPEGGDDDIVTYNRGESIVGVIDKESTYIHKLSSSVSEDEAKELADNYLRKEIANRVKFDVEVVNIKDLNGNLYRLGELTEFNSELFWRDGDGGVLLIKALSHDYSFGDNAKYQSKLTLVNDELYGNVINPVQVKESKEGDNWMNDTMKAGGSADSGEDERVDEGFRRELRS